MQNVKVQSELDSMCVYASSNAEFGLCNESNDSTMEHVTCPHCNYKLKVVYVDNRPLVAAHSLMWHKSNNCIMSLTFFRLRTEEFIHSHAVQSRINELYPQVILKDF